VRFAAGLTFAAFALANAPGPTRAQQAQPTLLVSSTIRAQPASRVKLDVRLARRETVAPNSFLRLKGVPLTASLSAGYAIRPGAWAVPLNALGALEIILPVDVAGAAEITISLVSVDGVVLGETQTSLVVAPAQGTQARGEAPQRVETPRSGEGVPLTPEQREQALALHAKGQAYLDQGNVYAARKFFERAVEVGWAPSAVALAATFDPEELAKLKTVGLRPDPAAARKWYEIAHQLGSQEASERLRRLGAR
jgi:hypothetical protein